ncbi:Uncharacterised protein [Mycobacteroides abscessus subsp. abscessus]|nr:Uncharacterised protein [Mycobacteroides abscessus subsp. abscessus]
MPIVTDNQLGLRRCVRRDDPFRYSAQKRCLATRGVAEYQEVRVFPEVHVHRGEVGLTEPDRRGEAPTVGRTR